MSNEVTPEAAAQQSAHVVAPQRTAKWWQIATVLVAGGMIAAACGSSSPTAAKKTTTTTHPKTTTTTSTTTAAPATTTTTAPGAPTTPTTKAATPGAPTTTAPAPAPTTTVPASSTPGGSLSANTTTPAASLTAAGSTFDQPLFSRQFYYYNQANHVVTVNYAAVGSGAGEADILANTVNFGASDVPEPAGTTGSGGAILQVPVVLGGIGIAYNLAGQPSGLHLTGAQIAQIYAGKFTNWSQVGGPNAPIITVHRSDSSGTSNAFTSYLNSVDPADWPASLVGKSPSWPSGNGALGGSGNAGVAGDVQSTPNSIGYVELAYALQSGLAYANVQNAAGAFVQPTLGSVSAAAAAFPSVSAGSPLIVNPPASAGSAYPISTYSWAIVYQKQSNTNNGIALGKLLDWMVTAGQAQAAAIGYAPLPSNVVSLAESTILQMQTASGQPLFTS